MKLRVERMEEALGRGVKIKTGVHMSTGGSAFLELLNKMEEMHNIDVEADIWGKPNKKGMVEPIPFSPLPIIDVGS